MESAFQGVFFEGTCQWGMNPGRPLQLMSAGIFIFAPLYFLALGSRGRKAGVWLLLPADRVLNRKLKDRPVKLSWRPAGRPLAAQGLARLRGRLRRVWRGVRLAWYFSLLSVFHLGWKELNVGNWLSRLQTQEYQLRATGWVRAVSGAQSLLSVYLLALWALSYFGRPFE